MVESYSPTGRLISHYSVFEKLVGGGMPAMKSGWKWMMY
jgi:hypothetical protein